MKYGHLKRLGIEPTPLLYPFIWKNNEYRIRKQTLYTRHLPDKACKIGTPLGLFLPCPDKGGRVVV
ncbi:hypothetical protein [Hugenholtzia roseola]|uniref:hypothetical protein n=1 Tax=Hugenholtzia roseola TaxID=1002 RepID=UPI00041ABE60|nr:hypothetical protein [Hugenholtzia roseola]